MSGQYKQMTTLTTAERMLSLVTVKPARSAAGMQNEISLFIIFKGFRAFKDPKSYQNTPLAMQPAEPPYVQI